MAASGSFEAEELRTLVAESARRKIESLRLYEPTPFQERVHQCTAKELACMAGNQVGKSLSFFVEDARAVTGQDPYNKYPEKDGVLVCLGLDEAHIGRVIHKYLFRAGAFQIIRDTVTQEWRAWKPWIPEDYARKDETKPAPPLIPQRFIKKVSWRKRSSYIFEMVELHTGWVIYAMSSKGEPAAGFQADLYHIDEDIERPDWYDEAIARLTMRNGKLRWSALPLAKNDALVNLAERADVEKDDEKPSTVVIRATIYDNPYMPEEVREENVKRWKAKGEDEYRKRALGEMVIDSVLMYPTFHKDVHNAISEAPNRTEVQKILTERGGEPPDDWCRYMVVDPGHSVCAVTFWTVPPESVGDQIVCYHELYLRNCDAQMFGTEVERAAKNHSIQEFIIDSHGGRLRELGTGLTPRQQYEKQLMSRGIRSLGYDHYFTDGCDNIAAREGMLREWLSIRRNGTPKMLVVFPRCPNLVREFGRFRKKVVGGVVQDDGNRRAHCHAVETCEYASAHGMPYVRPAPKKARNSWVATVLKQRAERARARAAKYGPEKAGNYTLGPQGDST